jgi:hypothetical protein
MHDRVGRGSGNLRRTDVAHGRRTVSGMLPTQNGAEDAE